jgi:hypothetical protein
MTEKDGLSAICAAAAVKGLTSTVAPRNWHLGVLDMVADIGIVPRSYFIGITATD